MGNILKCCSSLRQSGDNHRSSSVDGKRANKETKDQPAAKAGEIKNEAGKNEAVAEGGQMTSDEPNVKSNTNVEKDDAAKTTGGNQEADTSANNVVESKEENSTAENKLRLAKPMQVENVAIKNLAEVNDQVTFSSENHQTLRSERLEEAPDDSNATTNTDNKTNEEVDTVETFVERILTETTAEVTMAEEVLTETSTSAEDKQSKTDETTAEEVPDSKSDFGTQTEDVKIEVKVESDSESEGEIPEEEFNENIGGVVENVFNKVYLEEVARKFVTDLIDDCGLLVEAC